jgi:hypothetical protein
MLGGLQRAVLGVLEAATLFAIAGGCSGAKGAGTGESCSTAADCVAGDLCVYKIADHCSAKPVCQPKPTGTLCGGGEGVCGCSGNVVSIGCGDPNGYAGQPVSTVSMGTGCGAADAAKSSSPDATVPPASSMTSEASADASSAADADNTEWPDGEDGGAALGAGCVPEQELDKSFLGFSLSEVNIESKTFSCASRICLTNHFQGRVTCPYGQTADGGGYPPATGCTIPGTDTPVDGKDSNGTVVDPLRQAAVEPQCVRRTAREAVVCSCRCANTSGGVDDAGPYCTCPSGFDCAQLVPSFGAADPGLSGAYCIKSGTEYDPLDGSACDPTMLCDPKVANCGAAQGVPDAGPL